MESRLALFIILIILISCDLFENESKPKELYGCMDSKASNFNPDATIEDGSCDYYNEGFSFILLSTDSGLNWNIRSVQEEIGFITDISMVDSSNIWLCTNANAIKPIPQIIHTSDGGRTWIVQHSYDVAQLGQITYEYIEMFDMNNGIAFANHWTDNGYSIVLKTTDGGNNWVETTNDAKGMAGSTWQGVDFVDTDVGYYIDSGVSPSIIYKTIDSGITWNETNFVGFAKVIKFYDENIGVVVEGNGDIQITNDGGITWLKNSIPIIDYGNGDIEFESNNSDKVWFLSNYGIIHSQDGGITWNYKCNNHDQYMGQAIKIVDSKIMLFSTDFEIGNTVNCNPFEQKQLPDYVNGLKINLAINSDFDSVGEDTIVIPGFFSE